MSTELPHPSFLLSPTMFAVFDKQCEPLADSAILALKAQLSAYLVTVDNAVQRNEFIDHQLATRITQQLEQILDQYTSFVPAQQALIVGAARYFVNCDDDEHDLNSMFGFEDDLQVLNAVLRAIGRNPLT